MDKFSGMPDTVGIPWYEAVDYAGVKALMRDRHLLPDSFGAWLKKAEGIEQEVRATGRTVVRAVIRPDEFVQWTAAHGCDVDANGRTKYASFIARQRQDA